MEMDNYLLFALQNIKNCHYFQCFCKATLDVMVNACVPWSDAVNKLVQDAMISYPK